jgi:hypothetical protein
MAAKEVVAIKVSVPLQPALGVVGVVKNDVSQSVGDFFLQVVLFHISTCYLRFFKIILL